MSYEALTKDELVKELTRMGQQVTALEQELAATRKLAAQDLIYSNLLLSTQQEASLDGILVVGEQGQVLSHNRRFLEIWGIPPELAAKKSDELLLRAVIDKLSHPQEFLAKVEYLYAHQHEISRDEVSLKGDRTLDRYSAPLLGQDSRYYGRVWYFREITDLKRAQAEMQKAKDSLIERQARAILELSTPVLEVWDQILVLPVIGTVDTARAQQIIESLLEAIVKKSAAVVIMDITGVPIVDTKVAQHFLKTIAAARMLGAQVILTGVSPHNAQTLVRLGVDLTQITTKSSLQAGLRQAFEATENRVVKNA